MLRQIFLATALIFASFSAAHGQTAVITTSGADQHAGEFLVPLNKSQILRVDRPFSEILIGNTDIADVQPLTDRSIYVLGKQLGSTSLTIYGSGRNLVAVADLVVGNDVNQIKAKLNEMLPDETIEVRVAGDSVVLAGTVSSAAAADQASVLAGRIVGSDQRITNMLNVSGSQQVMLAVRFAEVSRSLGKDLAVNTSLRDEADGANRDGDQGGVFTGVGRLIGSALSIGGAQNRLGVATLDPSIGGTSLAVNFALDALENRGLVKILAEPNLIALSGDTANFLAGGEFPIPVPDDDGTTIEFKEFGVGLAFTPTVLANGLINVVLEPEVSSIDDTFAQTVNGSLTVPGLSTRRAKTTVELRDGQSFAIAGLLRDDFRDTVNQVPGIGDVPVLGALFRSSGYQRDQTELVIIVTTRLVQPVKAGTLKAPSDTFVPPSEADLFLFGRTEGESAESPLGAGNADGGIQGSYGYQLN